MFIKSIEVEVLRKDGDSCNMGDLGDLGDLIPEMETIIMEHFRESDFTDLQKASFVKELISSAKIMITFE